MRFTVKHPHDNDLEAVCGFDRSEVGWFAEVRKQGRILAEYDGLLFPNTSLRGVLQVLVRYGFFSSLDIAEAFRQLPVIDDLADIDFR